MTRQLLRSLLLCCVLIGAFPLPVSSATVAVMCPGGIQPNGECSDPVPMHGDWRNHRHLSDFLTWDPALWDDAATFCKTQDSQRNAYCDDVNRMVRYCASSPTDEVWLERCEAWELLPAPDRRALIAEMTGHAETFFGHVLSLIDEPENGRDEVEMRSDGSLRMKPSMKASLIGAFGVTIGKKVAEEKLGDECIESINSMLAAGTSGGKQTLAAAIGQSFELLLHVAHGLFAGAAGKSLDGLGYCSLLSVQVANDYGLSDRELEDYGRCEALKARLPLDQAVAQTTLILDAVKAKYASCGR